MIYKGLVFAISCVLSIASFASSVPILNQSIQNIVSVPFAIDNVISPTGRYIAYLHIVPQINIKQKTELYKASEIVVADIKGIDFKIKVLVNVKQLYWAQDSGSNLQLYYVAQDNSNHEQLYQLNLTTQKSKLLFSFPDDVSQIELAQHKLFYTINHHNTQIFKETPKAVASDGLDKYSQIHSDTALNLNNNTVASSLYFIDLDKLSQSNLPKKVSDFNYPINSFTINPVNPSQVAIVVKTSPDRKPIGSKIILLDLSVSQNKISSTIHSLTTAPQYISQILFTGNGKYLTYTTNKDFLSYDKSKQLIWGNSQSILAYHDFKVCYFNINNINKSPSCIETIDSTPQLQCALQNKVIINEAYWGRRLLYAIDIPSKTITALNKEGDSARFASCSTQNNMISFMSYNLDTKPQVNFGYISANNKLFASKVADPLLITKPTPAIKSISLEWKSKQGKVMQGYLVYPKLENPKKPIPLVIAVHGGPAHDWMNYYIGSPYTYDTAFSAKALVDQGYAVFMPNESGGWGRGTDFARSIYQNWCSLPYNEIMDGVDYIRSEQKQLNLFININKMAMWGWSYGGYMSLCAAQQIKPRYKLKAVIAGAAPSDLIEAYKQDPWFMSAYFGNIDANRLKYESQSAYYQIPQINTPILFEIGDSDEEVLPIQEQSIYKLLNQDKADSKNYKLVMYPKQNHGFFSPFQIYQAMDDTQQFLAKYLGSNK